MTKELHSLRGLTWLLAIPIEQLRELAARPDFHYRPFTSRKRKKPRRIDNPDAWLKGMQRIIRKRVLVPHPVSESVRACVKGGSPLRHARAVTGNQNVAEADLKNCFPSITNAMVFKLYRSLGFGVRNASVLTLGGHPNPGRSHVNDATSRRSSEPRVRGRPDAASTSRPWKATEPRRPRGDPAAGLRGRDLRERGGGSRMFDQINPAVHGSNRRHNAAVASAFSAAVIAG